MKSGEISYMLIGNFHHHLQAKGRLALPVSFRENLGDKPIMIRGVEPCINIMPFNIWSNLTANLGDNPLVSSKLRQIRRLIGHSASELEFDSQGRITIPRSLLDWAKLQKRVVVAGSIDWVEIWDLETYTRQMQESTDQSLELSSNQVSNNL